jgi:hypothetical protein
VQAARTSSEIADAGAMVLIDEHACRRSYREAAVRGMATHHLLVWTFSSSATIEVAGDPGLDAIRPARAALRLSVHQGPAHVAPTGRRDRVADDVFAAPDRKVDAAIGSRIGARSSRGNA